MFGANSAPILHPNEPKWDSAWPVLCRCSIWCVQNNFWAYGLAQTCTYLASRLALSPNRPYKLLVEPHNLGVPSGVSRTIFWAYATFSANRAPILHWHTLSPNRPKWDSIWPTSPRSSIGCIQNNFRAYGTFTANHATIFQLSLVT
jgi:hypothetical protein